MTVHLHWTSLLLACLSCLPLAGPATAKSNAAGDEDWQALLQEADAISEWADDPLADLDLLSTEPSPIFFSTSLAAGPGHSTNFLKRPVAVASRYLRAEGTAFLDWASKRSHLAALLYAEAHLYEESPDVSDEYMAFAQVDWSTSRDSLEFGTVLEAYYADQIYDASLTTSSAPAGSRIVQFRPQLAGYLDWFPASKDRLRVQAGGLRADYDIDREDYWEPLMTLEWERLWKKSLTTEARFSHSRQFYDEATGRTSRGIPLPEMERLEVDRFALEGRVQWNSTSWKWLKLQANAGLARESDRTGVYESVRQAWVTASARTVFGWGHLRMIGRWSEFCYDDRQVSWFDPATQVQTQRGVRLEAKFKLPRDFALYLRANWNRLDSRVPEEAFSERRLEGLLEWSY